MQVKIAMVGKYTDLADAYLSVTKALQHACLATNRKLKVQAPCIDLCVAHQIPSLAYRYLSKVYALDREQRQEGQPQLPAR